MINKGESNKTQFKLPSKLAAVSPTWKNGFTLIELMIVIMTMSLLFGLGFANYRDFQRRQSLESGVRSIISDLRYAQGLALAGRKPNNPAGNSCLSSVLHGYQLRRTGSTSYEIEAVCSSDVSVKTVNVLADIQIANFGSPVLFKVVTGGISSNSTVTITLSFPEGGVSDRSITISPAGEINN